jgi:hypothetical protein
MTNLMGFQLVDNTLVDMYLGGCGGVVIYGFVVMVAEKNKQVLVVRQLAYISVFCQI